MSATALPERRWTAGAVVLLVLGSLVAFLALALLAGGGAVLWATTTQRDESGYFTSSAERFSTKSYALTHEGVDIVGVPGFVDTGELVQVRIRAISAQPTRPLFVGIASEDAVRSYLTRVAHARVTDIGYHPFRVTYDPTPGRAAPARPEGRTFWAASKLGRGEAVLRWPVEKGNWSLVVMNGDGSRGVDATIDFGAKVRYLGWIGGGLIGGGVVALGLGALLIFLGGRRPSRRGPGGGVPAPPERPRPTVYPALIEGRLDEPLSRWLWLVKWLLALPHYVVLLFLWLTFLVLTVAAWFAILVTGRYPRGIFDFNVGVIRWTWRVAYYASSALGTDRYPPFSLAEERDYPATLQVEYPERLSRGLALVKWWLLALPHYLVVAILSGGIWWGTGTHFPLAGGLIGLLVVVAGVVLLFTGAYPRSIYELVLGFDRWVFRVLVYATLMTDRYPPFRLDMGGREPPATVTGPPLVPAGV